jgi:adenylyltransferase/sulfurtransferase
MGKTDWEIIKERRACNFLSRDDLLLGRAPTTPTTASVIAALQCQEAVKLLHGLEVLESQGFIFNGMTHDSYLVSYPRKADCLSHETLGEVRDLGLSVRDTRVGDLLGAVQQELGPGAVIELHNEVVEALACNRCQLEERVLTSLGKLTVKDGKCPSCGGDRFVKALHSLTGREDFLDRTFADLGVPPYDIITGRNGLDQIFLKFDGDAPQVLGPLHQS